MLDSRLRKGQPLEGRIRFISKNPKLKDINKKDKHDEERVSDSDEEFRPITMTEAENSENRASSEPTQAEDKSGPVIAYSNEDKKN